MLILNNMMIKLILKKLVNFLKAHRKISALFIVAFITLLFTPGGVEAIFFILLLPATAGALDTTIIIEAAFWCAVGVICGGGDVPPPDAVPVSICDPRHPSYSLFVPTIDMSLDFVEPSPWGNDVTRPAPGDEMKLTWTTTNSTSCYYSTTGNGVTTPESSVGTSGSQNFIPGLLTDPGNTLGLTIRCESTYIDELGVSCTPENAETYSLTVPSPEFNLPTAFTVFPSTIRYGSNAEFRWNITADGRAVYPLDCQIRGALTTPYMFNTGSIGAIGNITSINATNAFVNSLNCTEPISGATFTTNNRLDVIPKSSEI